MHFEIQRAYRPGKTLTPAQRTSSLFAEEPVVLGKILRRGSRPMKVTEAQFEANKSALYRLFKAGAIEVYAVTDTGARINLADKDAATKVVSKAPAAIDELKVLTKDTPPEDTSNAAPPAPETPPAAPVADGAPAMAPAVPESAPVTPEVVEVKPVEPATEPAKVEAAPEVVLTTPPAPASDAAPTAETGKKRGKKG